MFCTPDQCFYRFLLYQSRGVRFCSNNEQHPAATLALSRNASVAIAKIVRYIISDPGISRLSTVTLT